MGENSDNTGKLLPDETDHSQVTHAIDFPAREGDTAEKTVVLLEIVFRNQW